MAAFLGFGVIKTNETINRDGDVIFTAKAYYEPAVLNAWKKALEEKTGQEIDWQYLAGNIAEFRTLGYTDVIEDAIDIGGLDFDSFVNRLPH